MPGPVGAWRSAAAASRTASAWRFISEYAMEPVEDLGEARDFYLGIDAQRITFPDGARVPTPAQIAEGYRVRGAPGFTDSVVLLPAESKWRLIHSTQRRSTSRWCTGSVGLWPGSG